MKDLFLGLGQTGLFMTIGGAAFLFLLITFMFGGHEDAHDVGHDAGHGHGHDSDPEGHGQMTVSFFSPKILCIFLVAFGAGGTVASVYGLGPVVSSLIGFAAGISIGLLSASALTALYRQQANSLVTNTSVIGANAQVCTRIGKGAVGEVTFIAVGQSQTRLARSQDGGEIAVGKNVKITSVSGDSVIVQLV